MSERLIREIAVKDLLIENAISPQPPFISDVRARGIIVPLRVHTKGRKFVVDVGRRRALAAIAVGLETVPCEVGPELSSEDLLAENNLRRSNPVTDLIYIKDLMITSGLSEREIAKRTGMTVATQRKRLKLDLLIEPLKLALLELTDKGKPRLTTTLGERIAAHLSKAEQKKLSRILKDNGILTLRDYKELRATHATQVTMDLFKDLRMEVTE